MLARLKNNIINIVETIGFDMMRRMIDLYSGLGGASEAFLNAGWQVDRFESNPLLEDVPNTTLCDLKKYKVAAINVDFLWCSPPCYEFSQAFSAPGPVSRRRGEDYVPSMEHLEICIEHRDRLQPRWWVIENVVGAIPFFEPYLGSPRQIVGPFVLWGNFPYLPFTKTQEFVMKGHKAKNDKRWSPIRSNHRALIPYILSESMRLAVSNPTLEDYI